MARPLRIEFPGAVYHVTTRGNAKQAIFLDNGDRRAFLKIMGRALTAYNGICHAYCLMGNHYHLLLETPEANLSQIMKQINGVYTQRFNHIHQRGGHLFQGRFKSIVVDRDAYLAELCRYIALNPVRGGLVNTPGDYGWSSYNATVGTTDPPDWLHVDWLLRQFAETRRQARDEFRRFVLAGISAEPPWRDLTHKSILGGKTFMAKILPHLRDKEALKEIPVVERLAHRPSLDDIFEAAGTDKNARNQAMTKAHFDYGYKQQEIARHLGLHYTTVSNILRKTLK